MVSLGRCAVNKWIRQYSLLHGLFKKTLIITSNIRWNNIVEDNSDISLANVELFSLDNIRQDMVESLAASGQSIDWHSLQLSRVACEYIKSFFFLKFWRNSARTTSSCSNSQTYFIQYSHAKYLHETFQENWLDTSGTSCRIVSPSLKSRVANKARPY